MVYIALDIAINAETIRDHPELSNKFDLIVVDPPPLARSPGAPPPLHRARRARAGRQVLRDRSERAAEALGGAVAQGDHGGGGGPVHCAECHLCLEDDQREGGG